MQSTKDTSNITSAQQLQKETSKEKEKTPELTLKEKRLMEIQ